MGQSRSVDEELLLQVDPDQLLFWFAGHKT
jgi:hypothetical protein